MIPQDIHTNDVIKPKLNMANVDGNAYAIIGTVRRALKKAGNPDPILQRYTEQARSGNYDHLLQVTMAYVDVIYRPDDEEEEDDEEED